MNPAAMVYVKWPKLLVWHIATIDGITVCGLPITPAAQRGDAGDVHRLCRSCDRMKDATTVRPERRR